MQIPFRRAISPPRSRAEWKRGATVKSRICYREIGGGKRSARTRARARSTEVGVTSRGRKGGWWIEAIHRFRLGGVEREASLKFLTRPPRPNSSRRRSLSSSLARSGKKTRESRRVDAARPRGAVSERRNPFNCRTPRAPVAVQSQPLGQIEFGSW